MKLLLLLFLVETQLCKCWTSLFLHAHLKTASSDRTREISKQEGAVLVLKYQFDSAPDHFIVMLFPLALSLVSNQ